LYALIGVALLFTQTYPKRMVEHPVSDVQKDLEQQQNPVDTKDDVIQEIPAEAILQDVSLVDESPASVKANVY
jgi:hypothetical protein